MMLARDLGPPRWSVPQRPAPLPNEVPRQHPPPLEALRIQRDRHTMAEIRTRRGVLERVRAAHERETQIL
jgi:hypothetical protein